MTKDEILSYLKDIAKGHEVLIKECPEFQGVYLMQWKKYHRNRDGKVGTVFICINPIEIANENLLSARFLNALNTLKKNEPKAA